MILSSPDRRPIRIVVTGFGCFPGVPSNPTASLALHLARCRRAKLAGLSIAAHVFATRYQAVDADLPALLSSERPDALIMFGIAARSKHIRAELLARNRKSILFPDAGGAAGGSLAIAPGAPAALPGRFSLPMALAALRAAGRPAVISRDAGRYLCNYAYWRALEQAQPGGPRIVLFVHVPPIRTAPRPLRRVRDVRLTRTDLAQAGEALLLAVATMVRSSIA